MIERPHIMYVVNSDWFFLSHRLPIARAALAAGARVTVAAGDTGRARDIVSYGFEFVPIPISRKGTNPIAEVRTLYHLYRLYRRLRPDLVHHVTLKPVIYGSLVARLIPGLLVVNAITGLGYLFSTRRKARVLRTIVRPWLRFALSHPHSRTIFQNPDDQSLFVRSSLIRETSTALIKGSGVDCSEFQPSPEPNDVVVILPSRMLWDKGVQVFVDAAKLVRQEHPDVRFALVGGSDAGNPSAIPTSQLMKWDAEGVVEWWGYRPDMPEVMARASIVVLPTMYPEGVPKVLLEAAAAGRSIVATDVQGCREIVRHGVNGFLVPPGDPGQLGRAIERLALDRQMRERFGAAGRAIAVSEFAVEIVVRQTMSLYRDLFRSTGRPVFEFASDEESRQVSRRTAGAGPV